MLKIILILFISFFNSPAFATGTWSCTTQFASYQATSCSAISPPCWELQDLSNVTTNPEPYNHSCYGGYFNGTTHNLNAFNVPATYTEGPACPSAGAAVGTQGYVSVGSSPYPIPPNACDAGCPSQFVCTDCSKFSTLVDGKKEYYVFGNYVAKAGTCTEGEGNPYAAPELDADGCSSTQSKITMGGKTKCLDSDGKNTNPNSASAVADTKAVDDVARAAAINAASSAAAAAGLSASGVAAAAAGAAANYGGGGGASGKGKDPVIAAYCQENPTDKMCADEEFGEVEDSEVTNQDKPVAITPVSIGSAGVCPSPSTLVLHGTTHYFSWDTYCNFASGIKPIMLVFAWLSAAGILIGGFKE
jgi:hypothetical protein